MKKLYELPREFAEKWLAALRSGEYQQGRGTLVHMRYKDNTATVGTPEYCCLGVACRIEGIDPEAMVDRGFPEDIMALTVKVPTSIFGPHIDNDTSIPSLGGVLGALNDGNEINTKVKDEEGIDIIINPEEKKYSFEEIADWIEANVELIEVEEPEPTIPDLEYPQ